MSRRDPGAATGGIPTEPGHCECGEIESVHTVKADGSRGGCSRSGCDCRQYREARVARAEQEGRLLTAPTLPAPGPDAEIPDDFGWPPPGHEPPTAAEWYEPEEG